MRIKCQDCGETFEFTEAEEKFYEQHDLVPPKRCKSCRDARKRKYNCPNR